MLEKRRYGATAGIPTTPLLVVLLTSTLCLSLWHFSSPPATPPDTQPVVIIPSYTLLLPPGHHNATAPPSPPPYETHKLPPSDRTTLVDFDNFAFRINNYPCSSNGNGNGNETTTDSSPLILVLVHSAPSNVEKRDTIRNTWGRPLVPLSPDGHNPGMHRVLFLLGEVDSPEKQDYLDLENDVHHDLVQGSFRDTYRNMTYKHVMALKWTSYYCPGARYILKTDDDVFVNLPTLFDFIAQELSVWGARRLILCSPFTNSVVKRSYRSKWRVSPLEYAGHVYPTYCAGWAVLYSPDVVFLLYKEAQRSEYFWIDDVHVTGTLAARANLTQTTLGPLVLTDLQVKALIGDLGSTNNGSSVGTFLFGAPDLPQTSIYRLWRVVLQRRRAAMQHVYTPTTEV